MRRCMPIPKLKHYVARYKMDKKLLEEHPEHKEKLEKNGFSFESIHNMELSAIKVISQLSHTTDQFNPTRGIVVGNVLGSSIFNILLHPPIFMVDK